MLQNQTRLEERQPEAVDEDGAIAFGSQLLVYPYPESILLQEVKSAQGRLLWNSQAHGRHHKGTNLAIAAAPAAAGSAPFRE